MQRIIEVLFGEGRWKLFLKGYANTIIVAVAGVAIGVLIGALLAICKVLPRNRWWQTALSKFADLYLTVIRGTPVLVQLVIWHFIIFAGDVPVLLEAIIAFGINSGAYVTEIVRSGIMSIDRGQMEAGRSLGLSYGMSMVKIVMPQAIKNILPALGNEAIVLLKETSVASAITLMEFFHAAEIVIDNTGTALIPYLFSALVYLLTVMLMTFGLKKFEKRLRKSERRV